VPLRSGPPSAQSSRLSTIAVVLLTVVVIVGTALGYRHYQQRVDRETADAGRDTSAVDPSTDDASPSTSTTSPSPSGTTRPVSLWIGDGYTLGVGADSPQSGASCLAADELGWACELDAEEGTGFVSDGQLLDPDNQPLIDRLDALDPGLDPDVIVVDAGRNDLRVVSTLTLERAITDYLTALRERFPDATLIEIVPWSMGQEEELPGDLASYITKTVRSFDGHPIDPYAEGWVGAGHTDTPALQATSGGATQAGNAYLGEHLAQAIRDLGLPDVG
jgi:hypothetical protein